MAFPHGDSFDGSFTLEEPRSPRRLNKAIPWELETIVLKAMEKNPAERYVLSLLSLLLGGLLDLSLQTAGDLAQHRHGRRACCSATAWAASATKVIATVP